MYYNWAYKIVLGCGKDGLVDEYWNKLHGENQDADDNLHWIYN